MSTKPINMQADTFDKLKNDMTVAINTLLARMQAFGSDEATMTVKLDVEFLSSATGDTIPVFRHNIKSTVQVKDEVNGSLDENYALERDEDGLYELRELYQQQTLF